MEFCRVYHEIKAPTNRQYGKPEITGKIVFTPDLQKGEVWTDNGVVVPALPITCDVIDGRMYDRNGEYPSRYVNLMAGGPDANPNTMNWRVSYHDMRVGDEHFYIEPFIFKAIPYVKVNLKDVTPVAGYTPPGVIRGASGSPGIGIIFKGIVLTQDDLPVDGVENNHAYAITSTKDLAVWMDDEWLIIPNFANFDVNLEAISDLLYEARTNAEFSREQVGEMDRLRALAEKYSQAARDAVELGRGYVRKMEDHVSESITAAGRAEDLASQAAAAADEAVRILDQLDPLRDDVDAAHAEVARLHDEASQFTTQAAEHVLLASQHAADAQTYAQQALEHEAEGRRQATAALNAAEAAQGSAALAQGILDDADAILSQVSGHSQDAKDALSGAENLLANAGGQGKPLSEVLLEVAQKHQETLQAHDDILDLHTEVLQKHSEAIRYVAMAAAQASVAAQHAAQAAQEALNVATDAARAASSAAEAADEAAAAASNNSAAIIKLQEADTKLQKADEKLQDQMRVLEESQRALARAVQLLSGAVAQASIAAQHAAQAADNAGKAAEQALDAIDANLQADEARDQAIEAFQQTQTEIDGMQNDAIAALEAQAAEIAELQNRSANTAMVDREGTTHPDVTIFKLVNTTAYEVSVKNVAPGTKIQADFYNRSTSGALSRVKTEQYVTTSTSYSIDVSSGTQVVNLMWAQPSAQQVPISLSSNGMSSLDRVKWMDLSGLSRRATGRVTNGQLTIRCTWNAANRGSTYGIRVLVGTSVFRSFTTTTLGPLSFVGDGESRFSVSVTNLNMNAGQTFKVQVYSSAGTPLQRSVKSGTAVGSWIEHAS